MRALCGRLTHARHPAPVLSSKDLVLLSNQDLLYPRAVLDRKTSISDLSCRCGYLNSKSHFFPVRVYEMHCQALDGEAALASPRARRTAPRAHKASKKVCMSF